jgi:S-phase kinase-associated protein 1
MLLYQPLKTSRLADVVPEWYAQFINIEEENVYELMVAASVMQIEPLVQLAGAQIAVWMKDKTPEQLRQMFHLVNDFSSEEEAKLSRDLSR